MFLLPSRGFVYLTPTKDLLMPATTTWWAIVILGLLFVIVVIWFGLGYWRPVKRGFDPDRIKIDYQPARLDPLLTDTQGIVDMAYGDPAMYVPFWNREADSLTRDFVPTNDIDPTCSSTVIGLLEYLYDYRPPAELLVLGNGSIQLLAGYLTGVKQLVSAPEHRVLKVAINRPSMPILSDLVKGIGGIDIVDLDYDGHIDVEYVIVPNFTDNTFAIPPQRALYRLLDHAYAWPQYTMEDLGDLCKSSPSSDNQDTTVDHLFSLSKGVGFSGFRCGIGVIHDVNLHQMVTDYIVNTTLGINTAGWHLGLQVIDRHHRSLLDRCLAYGKAVLTSRWERLLAVSDPTLMNNHGAYAWFQRSPGEFLDSNIKVTRGSSLLVDDQWSRVSMIGPQQTFDLFVARLELLQRPVRKVGP